MTNAFTLLFYYLSYIFDKTNLFDIYQNEIFCKKRRDAYGFNQ